MAVKTAEERKEYQYNWYLANKEKHNIAGRKWYKANKEKRKIQNDLWIRNNRPRMGKLYQEQLRRGREYIASKKKDPCIDCGIAYHPFVMDFDHREGKRMAVSRMAKFSVKTIQIEIDKCDLVCSNCHRLRTLSRMKKGIYV